MDQVNSGFVSLILGAFIPVLIDVLNTRLESAKLKYLVAVSICFLIGFGIEYLNGRLVLENVFASAGIVFATAQSVYNLYWKESEKRTELFNV